MDVPNSDSRVVCSWQGPFFLQKYIGTINNLFVNAFHALQDQFWTGVGYIDADEKVCTTQIRISLYLMTQTKSNNM